MSYSFKIIYNENKKIIITKHNLD